MQLKFDDAEYTLSPVGMGVLLDAETHMRETDRTLAQTAAQLEGISDPLVKSVITEHAFRHVQKPILMDDVHEWLDTPHGVLFIFWHALKAYHKDMPLSEAEAVFNRLSRQQYDAVRESIFTTGIYAAPVEEPAGEDS